MSNYERFHLSTMVMIFFIGVLAGMVVSRAIVGNRAELAAMFLVGLCAIAADLSALYYGGVRFNNVAERFRNDMSKLFSKQDGGSN